MVKVRHPTIEELSGLTGKILDHVSHTNEITRILDVVTEDSSSDILVVAAIASLRKVSLKCVAVRIFASVIDDRSLIVLRCVLSQFHIICLVIKRCMLKVTFAV